MRLVLVLATAAFVAACAREPEPVVLPEPAPVTAEPVFSGKL
jgi:uncharacterized lipoprotein YajG